MVKRKIYRIKHGDILDIEEYHDGRYGSPGRKRQKKKIPTKEDMQRVNAWNKQKRCRLRMLEYFDASDIFATWTYKPEERPQDMMSAISDFRKAIRKVRSEYKKRGYELYWIRNIEQGTKGAWHIHLIVNRIDDTESILQRAWNHGGTWLTEIRKSGEFADMDFSKLSAYMTKDENTREKNEDGSSQKPRIKESSYSTSRNMPLPEPKVEKLIRWKKSPKSKKGYEIIDLYEGINPVTGYEFRRCTMIRIHRRI